MSQLPCPACGRDSEFTGHLHRMFLLMPASAAFSLVAGDSSFTTVTQHDSTARVKSRDNSDKRFVLHGFCYCGRPSRCCCRTRRFVICLGRALAGELNSGPPGRGCKPLAIDLLAAAHWKVLLRTAFCLLGIEIKLVLGGTTRRLLQIILLLSIVIERLGNRGQTSF